MNLYILDDDINKIAEYYCDAHVNSMILLNVEMLSAINKKFGYQAVYKVSSITKKANNKIIEWMSESLGNYVFVRRLTFLLNKEYNKRFDKNNHKSYVGMVSMPILPTYCFKNMKMTPFVFEMPDKFKIQNDIVASYRNFYFNHKREMKTWKLGEPDWWLEKQYCLKLCSEIKG